MKTKVQKWGNSLALRIPKAFAEEAGFRNEGPVEITLTEGKLVVKTATDAKPTLEQLLAKVTKKNVHHEAGTGSVVGREVW